MRKMRSLRPPFWLRIGLALATVAAEVLVALRSVDAVVRFDEQTPVELLTLLRPDVHVKSAQYRIEELPERYVVESNGGRIVLAPHLHGKSTTDLVATIRSRA